MRSLHGVEVQASSLSPAVCEDDITIPFAAGLDAPRDNSFRFGRRRLRLEYNFYVYITANAWHTIYVGVSNDLYRRIWEHKTKAVPGFTSRYGVDRLVYFEHRTDVRAAIAREKQIKAGGERESWR